jgi:D-alanyl-D-alanine dipeptidase
MSSISLIPGCAVDLTLYDLKTGAPIEMTGVYEFEWWHFDFKTWRRYLILNLTFDQLSNVR